MDIKSVLWDENGNFLGRNLDSWMKILGFYALYYSFLGVLFYGFTITYYMESRVLGSSPVGGKPAIRNGRLDMPGAVVHPFTELRDDGDISRFNMNSNFIKKSYCKKMETFFNNTDKLNNGENSLDCKKPLKTTKDGTCKVSLDIVIGKSDIEIGEVLNYDSCIGLTEKKMPMFTIDINKIIGWTPNNVGIHFQCYEYDAKTALKKDEQKFTFHWLTQSSIPQYYFPYNGVSDRQLVKLPEEHNPDGSKVESCNTQGCIDNYPYNKPFVAGIIRAKADEEGFNDRHEHMFRCDILSDKINRQLEADDDKNLSADDVKALNADLRKLNLGFVEFGYKY